jgi:hypothetical protein
VGDVTGRWINSDGGAAPNLGFRGCRRADGRVISRDRWRNRETLPFVFSVMDFISGDVRHLHNVLEEDC